MYAKAVRKQERKYACHPKTGFDFAFVSDMSPQRTPLPLLSLLVGQAGFLVGLPYQVFGLLPSPHLQLTKLRWLVAFLMLSVYSSTLLMPGMLGFGLAIAFEQVRLGSNVERVCARQPPPNIYPGATSCVTSPVDYVRYTD